MVGVMHRLKFTSLWYDDFFCEVIVEASNEAFAGKVELLLPYEKCSEMIQALDKFPQRISDEVRFTSGDELNHSALGLHFNYRDGLGNPSVSVSLRQREVQSIKEELSEATVVIHCDP